MTGVRGRSCAGSTFHTRESELAKVGFGAADVRAGRTADMGERWIVTEMQTDGYKFLTDPGWNVDLDDEGNEISRRSADRIRQRKHTTLNAAIDDYIAVMDAGGVPKIEHRPDGRSGDSSHHPLSTLELLKLVLAAKERMS